MIHANDVSACLPGRFFRTSRWFACKVDPMFFQMMPVIPCSVSWIAQHRVRIMAVACFIASICASKYATHGTRPGLNDPQGDLFAVRTYTQFRAKLYRFVQRASSNQSHMRLADTDNTIIAEPAFVLVHFPLPGINMWNGSVLVQQPSRGMEALNLMPSK